MHTAHNISLTTSTSPVTDPESSDGTASIGTAGARVDSSPWDRTMAIIPTIRWIDVETTVNCEISPSEHCSSIKSNSRIPTKNSSSLHEMI